MRQAIRIDDETARVSDAASIAVALAQCAYRLPGALVEVWQRPGWLLVEQAYDLRDLYTSYLEVMIDAPESDIPIQCPENDLYWFYVLAGRTVFANADGTKMLAKTAQNHYRLQYLPNGKYRCRFGEGLHQLFYTVHKPCALFREESPELDVHAQVVAALQAQAKTPAIGEALPMNDGPGEAIRKFLRAPGETFLQRKAALGTLALQLVFFAQASAQAKAGHTKIAAEWAETMKAYIDTCIETGKDIDQQTLVAHFAVSLSYLKYIFKSQTGAYPGAYIRTQKLLYAKSLIACGERPTDAARYVGWAYAHFSRAYKSYFGYSPSK